MYVSLTSKYTLLDNSLTWMNTLINSFIYVNISFFFKQINDKIFLSKYVFHFLIIYFI